MATEQKRQQRIKMSDSDVMVAELIFYVRYHRDAKKVEKQGQILSSISSNRIKMDTTEEQKIVSNLKLTKERRK